LKFAEFLFQIRTGAAISHSVIEQNAISKTGGGTCPAKSIDNAQTAFCVLGSFAGMGVYDCGLIFLNGDG